MASRRPAVAVIALLVGALFASATASAAPRPDEYTLPGENVFPEGITFQKSTGYFYVSSTTDGTIFRGHVNQPHAEVFLPGNQDGRSTAIGLAVEDNRLYIAGGATGMVFVYDTVSGDLLAALQAVDPAATATFVNDVTVTRSGDAFFTDSMNPVIYRVYQDSAGNFVVEDWLNLTGTAIEYQAGFNLNGIVSTPDGKYLIVVQSNTGELFRISVATGDVVQINTGDIQLTAGDGLVLQGRTLYVVRNSFGEIAVLQFSGQITSARHFGTITDDSFRFPTTADLARGRLLVVNSQFNERNGNPDLPFTVSSVKPRP